MKNLLKFISLAVIVSCSVLISYKVQGSLIKKSVAGSSLYNIYTIPTNGSSTIGTASTLIVATTTSRQYLTLVNDSASVQYISIGQAAVIGKGIRLNANGGAYELKSDQMFTAAIYGISSATGSLSYIQSN